MSEIILNLKEKIAPAFYKLHNYIKKNEYSEYWLKGGRGSTKSSFISIEIVLRMNKNSKSNACIFMKTGDLMRDSVYEQMKWAINELGQQHVWRCLTSPMSIINKQTGQKILFKGLYDKDRTKGAKIASGEFDIIWF